MSNYEFISNVLARSKMLLSPNLVFDVALESCCCSVNRVVNFPSPWPSSSRVTAVSLSFPERLSGHLLHHEEVKTRQTSRPQPGHKRGRRSCIRDAAICIDPPLESHGTRRSACSGFEAPYEAWMRPRTGSVFPCVGWVLQIVREWTHWITGGMSFFNLQTELEYMCTVIYIQSVHEKLWLFILNSD